jgi:signal transduction histidine kinase
MAQFTGKSKRLRKQAIIIISTSVIALVFDIIHYTLSKNGQFSWMWGVELIIFSVGLFISISYLRFTVPAPNLVSDYILDKINEMIFVIDTDGIIIESNLAMNKMLNKSAKDIIGNHLDEYLPYVFISIRDLKELNDLEINIINSDNSIAPIRVNSTRIIDKHNDFIGNVLVCTNLCSTKLLQEEISERKRIEDELIYADRAKDEFLSLVSHELLSPLSAIFLWVDLAKNDRSLQSKALDIIAENAQKQFLLVDELLLFTRLQHGKITLNLKEIEIIQIISDIIKKSELNNDSNRPEIIMNNRVGAIQALVDVDRFIQIIRLLIANSIAFSKDDKPINLSVIKTDNYIKILISNHREISTDIENIFNPLRDGVVNSGIDLNELHLAVARSLTELHGGYLNARNNDANDGLIFELQFPT